MSGTPQIQSKKSMKQRVQVVRELSVKKSLLAQDYAYLKQSREARQQYRMNSVDSSRHLVKDYESRTIVNQMLESNQISVEKPRNAVNVKSDFKRRDNYMKGTIENFEPIPFSKVLEEDAEDPAIA